MKALVISSKFEPEYSGSGLRAKTTYKRLHQSHGIKYDFIVSSVIFRTPKAYKINNVQIFRICGPFCNLKNDVAFIKFKNLINMIFQFLLTGLVLLLNFKKYDYVHTFGNCWSGTLATIIFSYMGKPTIRELCNKVDTPYYPSILSSRIRKIFQEEENSLVVAISDLLNDVCREHKVLNVWNRPNPVDLKKFNMDKKRNRNDLIQSLSKFSCDDIILVSVANFIPRKNHLFLIEVLKELPENFKLLITGPLKKEGEPYYNKICERIEALNLKDRVQVEIGFIANIEDYMSMSSVFLFPTKEEGLGTPMLEAQLCGVPIVTSKIRGITDSWVKNGIGGYESELEPREFADKINKALCISENVISNNAKILAEVVSAKNIDTTYYKWFRKLISIRSEKISENTFS